MSEEVKPIEVVVKAVDSLKPKRTNRSKTSKEVWEKVRIEFEAGTYKSMRELAEKHNITLSSLKQKVYVNKWRQKQIALYAKVSQVIEQKALSLAERQSSYLERLSKRGEKYEQLIDASLSQIGDLVDPDSIDSLTKSEIRIKELSCTGLRIPTLSGMDITSQGKSLGDSFVSAIAKLRESNGPKLTSQDLSKALDAEIIE